MENKYNKTPHSCKFNGQRRAIINDSENFYYFAVGIDFKWNYAEKKLCSDFVSYS